MLDYRASKNKYCNGWISISFRNEFESRNAEYAINKSNYILNSCDDGWFRKDNSAGITSSHGLMIRDIKITARKPLLIGDFIAYKAVIVYEDNNFDSEICTDKFWVFVHKKFDIENVLCYIEDHKEEWKP